MLQNAADPSAVPSVKFNVQAHSKRSNKKLPADVAATIFRCLQEKSVNPDKFKPHKPEVHFSYKRMKPPKDDSKLIAQASRLFFTGWKKATNIYKNTFLMVL